MLDTMNLIELAKAAASASKASSTYSFEGKTFTQKQLNDLLRSELNELAGSYAKFRENKNTIFTIMEEVIDAVLPVRVLEQYGQFAEIKTFNQGDKPVFREKITAASRRRAKRFVTKVGLAGVYEVFKLDGQTMELKTSAFGGAAQIGFEEFLDQRIQMSDVLDIVLEGLDEAVYREIAKALLATTKYVQASNVHTHDGFDEAEMDKLIAIADSYGKSTIYCTYEFAAKIIPDANWASSAVKDQLWNNGYLTNYKGHNVVVLAQSYEDETNTHKVMDPSYAFIIPTGSQKPVKVAFEGGTAVKEAENEDWSREIRVYKKFGVGTFMMNDLCVYIDSSLAPSV